MRDIDLQLSKRTLRAFFATQSTEYLTRVFDECRAGVFGYWQECHCIRGLMDGGYYASTNDRAACRAESALNMIGLWLDRAEGDALRRTVVLPIVLREISRRERRQAAEVQKEAVTA